MNADVLRLCEAVREAGGRAMLVGGSVRDRLLGIDSKDFDIEVYGLEPSRLRTVLEQIGPVNTVGEHFSVYKLVFYRPAPPQIDDSEQSLSDHTAPQHRFEIDVSLPRRESKSGHGHRGFVIEGDPAMSFAEAARRRDFTINAMLYDPLTDETSDPYGGGADLERRVLRAVAADTFIEDSLRVLRAVQLAARFEMTIDTATVELCRTIDLSDLPRERIWGEIEKLLTLAEHPSIGLEASLELGVLDQLFPEIRSLVSYKPEEDGHPAEDAFAHTKLSLDEAVRLASDLTKPQRVAVMLATLCHDLGKPTTSSNAAGASPERDKAAGEPTRAILNKLGLHAIGGYHVRSQVLALVREHLKPSKFYRRRATTTEGDFRRLARRVDIDLLYRVAKACALGRGSASSTVAEDWFIERARAIGVEHGPPAPLLQGRHLLQAGFEPGPQMGKLLRSVYELQLDGEVTTSEEALAAAHRIS
ncbi:MAG TPA: polynucleotide adenylyltransferase [Blastocatellia bacterium]|nr:polynucleotide adenylyltransferase [Blastocatellia bacterium]